MSVCSTKCLFNFTFACLLAINRNDIIFYFREAVATARRKYDELSNFTVHLATDCTVYKEDIMDLYSSQENGHLNDLGILLLMPVRLGVERLNPIYVNNVTFLLSLDQSVGVIGGKPKHSLYFIGFQGTRILLPTVFNCLPAFLLL